jgi:prepilin-type processing-associated H-X9-DG protein
MIGILTALLLPVFARAREKGRRATCISNCKQIGTAMQLYAHDYDERLPGWDNPFSHPAAGSWIWAIVVPVVNVYSKSDQIWTCPSAPKSESFLRGPKEEALYVHYGYNEYLYNSRHVVPPYYSGGWNSLASLGSTRAGLANIAMVADCATPGVFNDWGNFDGIQIAGDAPDFGIQRIKYANGWSARQPAPPRHAEHGANILFVDGHAAFVFGERMRGSYGKGTRAQPGGLIEWPVVNPLNIPPP